MKTCFSVWQGRIAPVFDVSSNILIQETEEGKVISEYNLSLPAETVFDRVSFLADNSVDVIVCGAVSRETAMLMNIFKVKCISFISGSVEDVIAAYNEGYLSESRFLMPGCGRQNRCRRRSNFRHQ
ncbi:MAG: NifB/NifX family molybdenum-iron cluster-binding protein [Spirochaetia bacterium]|jgi:predicted Fe-Mo cluster-binding NifX family protein|nr:NifB/NifX family molybdenum-iron cluster-binding protein [Spirochaetia bacterium]